MLRIQFKTSKLIVNQYLKYATHSLFPISLSPYFSFFSLVHEFMSPSEQREVLLAFLWITFISNTEQ